MTTAPIELRIGQYLLRETIGSGSFGKVKLAQHSQTGHKVAMKILNRRKIRHSEMAQRVKREIQNLKLLRHPHIIKLYEVLSTPADILMVMEYASGELFQLIVEKGRLEESQGRRYFQQIISAVEFCHRHQMLVLFVQVQNDLSDNLSVHRDLKPENLLLDPHGNVKIADFGLSNFMRDGNFMRTSCGSPNYAAPEVLSGKLYAGPEVDIWSCGVILYVMLVGKLPFDDPFFPNLFKKISEGRYTIPPSVSDGARELISAMLRVDPVSRIDMPGIRTHPWFQTDLPAYLKPLPELSSYIPSEVDMTIVEELERKLGMGREKIVSALLPVGEGDGHQQLHHQNEGSMSDSTESIRVAYQLVADHRLFLKTEDPDFDFNLSASSPPPWDSSQPGSPSMPRTYFSESVFSFKSASYSEGIHVPPSAMRRLSSLRSQAGFITASSSVSSLSSVQESSESTGELQSSSLHEIITGSQLPFMPVDGPPSSSSIIDEPPHERKRVKWHVGLRSQSDPKQILLEIYKALKKLDLSWLAPRPRRDSFEERLSTSREAQKSPLDDPQTASDIYTIEARQLLPDGLALLFDISVYSMPEKPASSSSSSPGRVQLKPTYLVDFMCRGLFKNESTEACDRGPVASAAFLEICSKLIIELAVKE